MLVKLYNADGSQVHQSDIDGTVYPEGFLFEGKVYIAWRIQQDKTEMAYREKVISTLPPDMHPIEGPLLEG